MPSDVATALSRAVEVVRIPTGERLELPAGADVIVTQALGGSFTLLVPSHAGLYRLEGEDADAIGKETPSGSTSEAAAGDVEGAIWDQLRTCYDPEIPVNIVDLGLIYSLDIDAAGDEWLVSVQMTLTAPGCGMGPLLAAEARQRILTVPGVKDVTVDLVWDPPWTPERISEAGKEQLGIM